MLSLPLLLVGCANRKEDIFPADMPTMGQVYDRHFGQLQQTQSQAVALPLQADPALTGAPSAIPDAMGQETTAPSREPTDQRPVHNGTSSSITAIGDPASPKTETPRAVTETDGVRFIREAGTELDTLFPTLPNPHLVMFVYPHLSEEGTPVPGYATSFPLYEKTEYALPGDHR